MIWMNNKTMNHSISYKAKVLWPEHLYPSSESLLQSDGIAPRVFGGGLELGPSLKDPQRGHRCFSQKDTVNRRHLCARKWAYSPHRAGWQLDLDPSWTAGTSFLVLISYSIYDISLQQPKWTKTTPNLRERLPLMSEKVWESWGETTGTFQSHSHVLLFERDDGYTGV